MKVAGNLQHASTSSMCNPYVCVSWNQNLIYKSKSFKYRENQQVFNRRFPAISKQNQETSESEEHRPSPTMFTRFLSFLSHPKSNHLCILQIHPFFMKIRENKVIQPKSFAKLYSIVFLQVSVFITAQNLTEKTFKILLIYL